MGKKSEITKRNRPKQSPLINAKREENAKFANKSRVLHNPVFHILFIFVIAFLAYSDSFHTPFTFDDAVNITDNPNIRNISRLIGPLYGQGTIPQANRYIGMLTFALNYRLHGTDVAGYHIVNFGIHVANALLVYLLVFSTFRTPFLSASALKEHSGVIAFFSGLLFVAHPLQTQAVTYIVQRLTSLATLFFLLSVVLYIKWRSAQQTPGHGEQGTEKQNGKLKHLWILFSFISAVLAMRTKEISFTLPFIIVLYEILFFKGSIKKRILYIMPFLITLVIIPLTLMHFHVHKPVGDLISNIGKVTRLQTDVSRWEYLFTQFRVIVTYLRLFVLPVNQNLDYEYPLYRSFFNPEVFLSFLFLLCIGSLAIYLLYRNRNTSAYVRIISFGICWFFITLSIESGIIPITDVIFEHRMYLPSVGLFISLSTACYWFINIYKDRWKNIERIVVGTLAGITIILAGATYARNAVWLDNISLWKDTVSKSPGKPRSHINLGKAYEDKGLYDKALEEYAIAMKLNPDDGTPYYYFGNLYLSRGLIDKAIEQYHIALQVKPHDPNGASWHYNLGNAYLYKGLFDKAIEEYAVVLKMRSSHAGAYNNMGNAYMQKGLLDKAVENYRAALRIQPDNAQVYGNLGNAYLQQGFPDKAIEQYRVTLKFMPENADAHFNLGLAYLKKQETDSALKEFETVLKLNPALKEARNYIHALSEKGSRKK